MSTEKGGNLRVGGEDFSAALTMRMFDPLGTSDDFLGGFGRKKIVASLMLGGGALTTFAHDR